jgi:hypothetical protein
LVLPLFYYTLTRPSVLRYRHLGLRDEIEKKMDKAIEPPPTKAIKALPRPDDAVRKKRGGKR